MGFRNRGPPLIDLNCPNNFLNFVAIILSATLRNGSPSPIMNSIHFAYLFVRSPEKRCAIAIESVAHVFIESDHI